MEPLNKSRSPSAPLFAGGDGVAAMAGQPAARRGFRSPCAAGRPSGGPKGRAGCVAAHCVVGKPHGFPAPCHHALLGFSGLPGLAQRFPMPVVLLIIRRRGAIDNAFRRSAERPRPVVAAAADGPHRGRLSGGRHRLCGLKAGANWRFATDGAQVKLRRLHPTFDA